MDEIARYRKCFVCGEENPIGLRARFFYDGQRATTTVDAKVMFEGYPGIYHGGIISTVLDEVMIKSLLAKEIYAVTAELAVKFARPVKIGDKLIFSGWIVKNKRRFYSTEGTVADENGTIYASATAKYIEVRAGQREKMLGIDNLDM